MNPSSDIYLKWWKHGSCPLLQWPSCLRMFSCSCSQSWWVSSFTYLYSSDPDPSCLHVTVINEREFVILSQWNNVFSICGGVGVSRLLLLSFSVSQSIITAVDWCLLMTLIPLIKTILSSNLFWMNRLHLCECINKTQDSENLSRASESAVMVLFVQRITANLFCRWRVKKKTQSPSSLFRRSCGEHSKI